MARRGSFLPWYGGTPLRNRPDRRPPKLLRTFGPLPTRPTSPKRTQAQGKPPSAVPLAYHNISRRPRSAGSENGSQTKPSPGAKSLRFLECAYPWRRVSMGESTFPPPDPEGSSRNGLPRSRMKVCTSSAALVEERPIRPPPGSPGARDRNSAVRQYCRQFSRPPGCPACRRSGDSRPEEPTTTSSSSLPRKKYRRKPKRCGERGPISRLICDAESITVVRTSQNEPCMPPVIFSVDDGRRAVPDRRLKPLPPTSSALKA